MTHMERKHFKLLIIAGLALLAVGAVSTGLMDARLSEVNRQLSAEGMSSSQKYEERTALIQERDTLAQRIPGAIAALIVGAVMMAADPLAVVAGKWRAGQLSGGSKRAVLAIMIGAILAIVAILAAITTSARLAEVDRGISGLEDRKTSDPSSFDSDDWDDYSNLQAERSELSGRMAPTIAVAFIGIAALFAGCLITWRNRGEFAGRGTV